MHRKAMDNPQSDRIVGRLGMAFHANFFYKEAERCYLRATQLNERQWRWYYYIALLREETGDAGNTISNLENVLERNEHIPMAWYRLGNALFKKNQYSEASRAFNRVLEQDSFTFTSDQEKELSNRGAFPLRAYALLNLNRIAIYQNDLKKAQNGLFDLIKKYPTFGPAYQLLSDVHYRLGEEDKGRLYAVQAADFMNFIPPADVIYDDLLYYSRSTEFIMKQIDIARKSRNIEWAVALNRHIFEYDPYEKLALSNLLEIMVLSNQTEGLNSLVTIFIKLFNDDGYGLLKMSRFLIYHRQYRYALELIRHLVSIDPESMEAHIEFIKILGHLGDYTEAEKYCRTMIMKHPGNTSLRFELARILLQQGKFSQSGDQLAAARKLEPDNSEGLLIFARLHRKQNNIMKALDYYTQYLERNSSDHSVNVELGNYLIDLRKWKRALRHFEKALSQSPNHVDYIERCAWILAACPDPHIRNAQRALGFAERLSVIQKNSVEQIIRSAMTISVAYAGIGQFDNAVAVLMKYKQAVESSDLKNTKLKFQQLQLLFESRTPYLL